MVSTVMVWYSVSTYPYLMELIAGHKQFRRVAVLFEDEKAIDKHEVLKMPVE
jgi:hypothetical protein